MEENAALDIYPPYTRADILQFQFSSWYPQFSSFSIKSTIVRPLSEEFCEYLHSDGVFVPEGSEDVPAQSTLCDDEDADDPTLEDGDTSGNDERQESPPPPPPRFAFPELDAEIRSCIQEYGAVFPKLNFSSAKDAAWVLPASSPLKCTTPADIYLVLKSSDFVLHDLTTESVFEGCSDDDSASPGPEYALELVLRKWYAVDRGRELRCFVREGKLLGISQRDTNYYQYLNDPATQETIRTTVSTFWGSEIQPKWKGNQSYTFDLLLTRDLSRAHIVDFNPYAPRTDGILFTYGELRDLMSMAEDAIPVFRVIDSMAHPACTSNTPTYQHNMVPFDALKISSGRDIEEFADMWQKTIKESSV